VQACEFPQGEHRRSPTMKLTDTQLIVLSSAAKHDDGLAARPANLNAAAAAKVASSLISKGLFREIRAKADAPVWHENGDGRFARLPRQVARRSASTRRRRKTPRPHPRLRRPRDHKTADRNRPQKRMRRSRPLHPRKGRSRRPLTRPSPRPANSAPVPSRQGLSI
jgi:hypothetical protein